jgi:hypothetical protein
MARRRRWQANYNVNDRGSNAVISMLTHGCTAPSHGTTRMCARRRRIYRAPDQWRAGGAGEWV